MSSGLPEKQKTAPVLTTNKSYSTQDFKLQTPLRERRRRERERRRERGMIV